MSKREISGNHTAHSPEANIAIVNETQALQLFEQIARQLKRDAGGHVRSSGATFINLQSWEA